MKIIIDISEEDYKVFIRQRCNDSTPICRLYKAIKNGTPIPDNVTNGEVLISLYPNLKYIIQNGRVVTTIGVASSFDLDWWNDKYKAESEE